MAEAVANQNPDVAKVVARTGECMRRLMEAGVTFEDLQKPIDSPLFRRRLARLWHDGATKLPGTPFALARSLCDGNYLGPNVARDRLGSYYTHEEFPASIPFNEYELREKGKDHLLVWDPGLSIWQMKGMVPDCFFDDKSMLPGNYQEERGVPGWHLVRKDALPYTPNKTWERQKERLGEEERVPSARLVVYAMIAHYLSMNSSLPLFKSGVRTSTINAGGNPFVVVGGHTTQLKISIEFASKDSLHGVGLASETLPESEIFK